MHTHHREGEPEPDWPEDVGGDNRKGRVISDERRFWAVASDEIDWSDIDTTWDPTNGLIEAEDFTTTRSFDALDRVVEETSPDGTVTTSTWNQRGLPDSVTVGTMPIVSSPSYNARGQRLSARLGLTGEDEGVDVAWLQYLRYWYDPVGG